jgi:prepilin-type N-terminal cleavage/methylation domain-containing protein
MKTQMKNPQPGFTLMELMVAMALGLMVMAAMASLFKMGMNSTILIEQRAETQQNMRAAIDLMAKDISLAGAGLPSGGIQLPVGITSLYGCDSATCFVPNGKYPAGNFMYGIIPGFSDGVQGNASIPAAPAPAVNDSITVIYADYNFPLYEYDLTFVAGQNGGQVTGAVDAQFAANPPPAINAAGGIQQGDLIMISGGGQTAVGEVTTAPTATTITFANLDPLNINDSGAASGNLNQVAVAAAGANCVGYRLYAVTYYLMVPGGFQTPRLMRQVNGLAPVPVADDIINLQFSYDVYNSTVTPAVLDANQANPIGAGESPNNIQKVNLVVIGESMNNWGNKSQSMSLATSVSAGNMSYISKQNY